MEAYLEALDLWGVEEDDEILPLLDKPPWPKSSIIRRKKPEKQRQVNAFLLGSVQSFLLGS